jgi:cbb3-type cytochrome oxidase maturation protein
VTILAILIPVALGLGLLGLGAFLWSVSSGQYEDLEGAAVRILQQDPDEPDLSPNRSAPEV